MCRVLVELQLCGLADEGFPLPYNSPASLLQSGRGVGVAGTFSPIFIVVLPF